MLTLHILADIPPFIGFNGEIWRLCKGDLVGVGPGVPFKKARDLVSNGTARWVKPVDEIEIETKTKISIHRAGQ